MIKNPKKVFTKANIFETVWNEQFVYDDKVINTHISNLRAKTQKG
jgi:DNA-binding response OmpR family regulator